MRWLARITVQCASYGCRCVLCSRDAFLEIQVLEDLIDQFVLGQQIRPVSLFLVGNSKEVGDVAIVIECEPLCSKIHEYLVEGLCVRTGYDAVVHVTQEQGLRSIEDAWVNSALCKPDG